MTANASHVAAPMIQHTSTAATLVRMGGLREAVRPLRETVSTPVSSFHLPVRECDCCVSDVMQAQ